MVQGSTVHQKYDLSHLCNFKSCMSHIKKSGKKTDEIHFHPIFYLVSINKCDHFNI